MDKLAAEKIASEYYEAGLQLALQEAGLTKTAMSMGGLLKRLGIGAGAGYGGLYAAQNARLLPEMLGGNSALAKSIAEGAVGLENSATGLGTGVMDYLKSFQNLGG
jgi:hypothetical protein